MESYYVGCDVHPIDHILNEHLGICQYQYSISLVPNPCDLLSRMVLSAELHDVGARCLAGADRNEDLGPEINHEKANSLTSSFNLLATFKHLGHLD